MELKVWVDGFQRLICGIDRQTTCQEVIYALAHATGKTGRFVLVEKWRTSERSLAPHDKPLELLLKWGEYAGDVQFVLRCLGRETVVASTDKGKPATDSSLNPDQSTANAQSSSSSDKTLLLDRYLSTASRPPPPQYVNFNQPQQKQYITRSPGAQRRCLYNPQNQDGSSILNLSAPPKAPPPVSLQWAEPTDQYSYNAGSNSLPRLKKQHGRQSADPRGKVYSINAVLSKNDPNSPQPLAPVVDYNRKPVPPSPSILRSNVMPGSRPVEKISPSIVRPPPPSYEHTMKQRQAATGNYAQIVPSSVRRRQQMLKEDFWPITQPVTSSDDFRDSLLTTAKSQEDIVKQQLDALDSVDKTIEMELSKLNRLSRSLVDTTNDPPPDCSSTTTRQADLQSQLNQLRILKMTLQKDKLTAKDEMDSADRQLEQKRQILTKLADELNDDEKNRPATVESDDDNPEQEIKLLDDLIRARKCRLDELQLKASTESSVAQYKPNSGIQNLLLAMESTVKEGDLLENSPSNKLLANSSILNQLIEETTPGVWV